MALRRILAGIVLALGLGAQANAFEYRNAPQPVRIAPPGQDAAEVIRGCIESAAALHGLPAPILVVILRVENGRVGRITANASGAPPDIGPMQVNGIWVTKIAERWRTTRDEAFLALRDNFCANVEAGAWILAQAMRDARGDFWEGVAFYHSRTPEFKRRYKRLALEQALVVARLAVPQTQTTVAAR